MQTPDTAPLNPLPPVVWALVLPLIAMEIVLAAGSAGLAGGPDAIGWRIDAMERFGFWPEYLRAMRQAGQWPLDGVMRFVTYPLVHASTTNAIFGIVFLLALGKFVGEIYRWWAVLAVVLGATAGGALLYALLPWFSLPLFGAFPAAYGLIGAFTYILWMRLARSGENRIAAFRLIAVLMAFQLVFGAFFSLFYGAGVWANPVWIAEVAGFAIGFGLSFVVSPGALHRLRATLRQR